MQDQTHWQTCNAANIAIMEKQVFKLSQMEASLHSQLNALEGERDWGHFINRGLFVSRIIKASCDVMISVLGEMTGPKGEAIADAYSVSSDWTTVAVKKYTGQNYSTDLSKATVNTATTGLNRLGVGKSFGKNTSMTEEFGKEFVNLQGNKTQLVLNAMQQNEDALWKDMGSYFKTLSLLATEAAGNAVASKAIKISYAFANGVKEMSSAYQDFKNEDPDEVYEQQKAQITRLMRTTADHIKSLRLTILSCQPNYHNTTLFA